MSALEIAAVAAALVVEEGLEYGPAKRRALKQLGLSARTALPGNDELELAVREYIEIFCADTQPQELQALRRLALQWMARLAVFHPHLSGAVWHGTATRRSDIHLQLFCKEEKTVELLLLDKGVTYQTGSRLGFQGETVDVLSIHAFSQELAEHIGVHLALHDYDDLRGALKPDGLGRSPRGPEKAVKALLQSFNDD
jgi:hypothetical protein